MLIFFRQHFLFIALSIASGFLLASFITWVSNDRSSITSLVASPFDHPVSYADAVKKAQASVVNIYTSKFTIENRIARINNPFWERILGEKYIVKSYKKRQNSLGSGVIVNAAGYILTNHHVIDGADEISVVLSSGRVLKAQVIGTDPDTDLAVLQTNADDLPPINVGDVANAQVGDVVLAIGNPFGIGQTVTMGIIGATGRSKLGISTFENFIQTDAAINPGNSGGALVDAQGNLVGINTAIFSESGGSQGIGFAIPIDMAQQVMSEIMKNGRVVRGWLGMSGDSLTKELAQSYGLKFVAGVLISSVLEGGPADLAGIEPGDILTHINGQASNSSEQVIGIITAVTPGEEIEIKGVRLNREFITKARVIERPRMLK